VFFIARHCCDKIRLPGLAAVMGKRLLKSKSCSPARNSLCGGCMGAAAPAWASARIESAHPTSKLQRKILPAFRARFSVFLIDLDPSFRLSPAFSRLCSVVIITPSVSHAGSGVRFKRGTPLRPADPHTMKTISLMETNRSGRKNADSLDHPNPRPLRLSCQELATSLLIDSPSDRDLSG
jgi:hypothetical protein